MEVCSVTSTTMRSRGKPEVCSTRSSRELVSMAGEAWAAREQAGGSGNARVSGSHLLQVEAAPDARSGGKPFVGCASRLGGEPAQGFRSPDAAELDVNDGLERGVDGLLAQDLLDDPSRGSRRQKSPH